MNTPILNQFNRFREDIRFILNETVLDNSTNYKIIDSLEFDSDKIKLYPVINFFQLKNEIFDKKITKGFINLYLYASETRLTFTKLQVNKRLLNSNYPYNMLSKVNFTNGASYYINNGIIRDSNHNTLLCFCFDNSKVDFENGQFLNDSLYLLLDIKRLLLPENKKLFSFLNGKNSIIENCINENIDIIYSSLLDKKLFISFNKEFNSIADRKKYFEELINELKEKCDNIDIDNIDNIDNVNNNNVDF